MTALNLLVLQKIRYHRVISQKYTTDCLNRDFRSVKGVLYFQKINLLFERKIGAYKK